MAMGRHRGIECVARSSPGDTVLSVYVADGARLQKRTCAVAEDMPEQPVWLDMLTPTADEDALVERKLKLYVPTRDEMQEIEPSSRLYTENGACYMTATLLSHTDTDHPQTSAVTFILSTGHLITVRYAEPKSFDLYSARVQRPGGNVQSGDAVLVGLLEAVIDRAADILERLAGEIERISKDVFQANDMPRGARRPFRDILNDIGHRGDLDSKIGESLASLGRLLAFLASTLEAGDASRDLRGRVSSIQSDVRSLSDYASFLADKITFLLDATLGLINIEQNTTIKIFSVAAVVFMPPTLIASIYGMNFVHMPELHWRFGYPMALLLLVASAVVTYGLFKRRGWL
jgi:magnesium transporter